jgi:hypothetical protein
MAFESNPTGASDKCRWEGQPHVPNGPADFISSLLLIRFSLSLLFSSPPSCFSSITPSRCCLLELYILNLVLELTDQSDLLFDRRNGKSTARDCWECVDSPRLPSSRRHHHHRRHPETAIEAQGHSFECPRALSSSPSILFCSQKGNSRN